jgi:hypothetical protein
MLLQLAAVLHLQWLSFQVVQLVMVLLHRLLMFILLLRHLSLLLLVLLLPLPLQRLLLLLLLLLGLLVLLLMSCLVLWLRCCSLIAGSKLQLSCYDPWPHACSQQPQLLHTFCLPVLREVELGAAGLHVIVSGYEPCKIILLGCSPFAVVGAKIRFETVSDLALLNAQTDPPAAVLTPVCTHPMILTGLCFWCRPLQPELGCSYLSITVLLCREVGAGCAPAFER